MSDEITIKPSEKVDSIVDASCGECKKTTKHTVLSGIKLDGSQIEMLGDRYETIISWNEEYQIIQCRGCETITFRRTHQNSENYDQHGYTIFEDIYPNPEEGRAEIKDTKLLPSKLQRIYSETINSLNSDLPILAGIGIRAILETTCKDKKAKGKDLSIKINDLVKQGVLTQDGANILHKLRTLGNKAAHEAEPHDVVQLGLALDVIEHMIQGVYILPYHARKKFN